MPLNALTLAQDLERLFNDKPPTSVAAAMTWANAYQAYASAAMSSAASLPVTAPANFGILLGGFQGGLSALSPATAGALIAQGILAYWQAMAWVGPTGSGATVFPGNAALAGALAALFADLGGRSATEKGNALARVFDAGARMVVVSDVPFAQPAPPIVGPIM